MGNITLFNMGLYVNTLDFSYSETFLLCNLTLQRVRSKMILSNHLKDFGSVVMVCRTSTDCENTSRVQENSNVKELSGTTCKVASSSWQPGTTFKM